jgi:uracil-DNA glycosylase family 4
MQEYNEDLLEDLISEALSSRPESENPFSDFYLGLGESDLLSIIHQKLSKKIIESDLNEIFQDVKSDILSRKSKLTLKNLHTLTKNCDKCNLAIHTELPKWNVKDPQVIIVAEHPNIQPEAIDLIVNSAKSAGFTSNDLCLTFVNRCPIKRKFEDKEILNCSPYLHSEIQLLNPKLVVTLGALPSSVLFGTSIKIRKYRGNITWLGYWPIMVTYSPAYALKSGESSSEIFSQDFVRAFNFVKGKK